MTKCALDAILGESEDAGLTLIGAYGRETTIQDWKDGKDFQIVASNGPGPYCSIRDAGRMKELGWTFVQFLTRNGKTVIGEERL